MTADRLHARNLTLRYEERTISQDLSVTIPDGSFTVVVGPNACGKSTLLRALSRLLAPASGSVILDGKPIGALSSKDVARRLVRRGDAHQLRYAEKIGHQALGFLRFHPFHHIGQNRGRGRRNGAAAA